VPPPLADAAGHAPIQAQRGVKDKRRAPLMRALHAEGARRGLDHADLRARAGVASLSEMDVQALARLYLDVTGTEFLFHATKAQRVTLPPRGCARRGSTVMASAEELELLERAMAVRGWGTDTKKVFVRRQLRGREVIRTRADFQRVFRGVQAMNRRDGLEHARSGHLRRVNTLTQ